jgi:hypothetical protein
LTFSDRPREVIDPAWHDPIRLKPFQRLVWFSLTHRGLDQIPPGTKCIPALLDTGHHHNCSLREEHLGTERPRDALAVE